MDKRHPTNGSHTAQKGSDKPASTNGEHTIPEDSYRDLPNLTEVDLLRLQKAFLDRQNKQLALENATIRQQQAQREMEQSSQEMNELQIRLHQKYGVPENGTLNLQTGIIVRERNSGLEVVES